MHIDIYKTVAGLIVGFVIGLTGMGGGALMTPVLVILFGVDPGSAVSSDVITSLILKPFGAGIHARRKTVNWGLVRWLIIGSVPAAFSGAYLLDTLFSANSPGLKHLLGWVLLVATLAIVANVILQTQRRNDSGESSLSPDKVRPLPTLLLGVAGGFIVGMTSVGSGSLIIVLLMLLYPKLSSREMVGTDLVQAIPLVGAAAIGHLLFGDPKLELIVSVLIGAIPAVMLGAHFSSHFDDRFIRPALVAVLALSSLSLLGVPNSWLLRIALFELVAYGFFVYITGRKRAMSLVVPEIPVTEEVEGPAV